MAIRVRLVCGAMVLSMLSQSAFALVEPGNQGYWFYKEPPRISPPKESTLPPQRNPTPQVIMGDTKQEDDCNTNWRLECGFIEPSTFAQQEKMRDALMQNAYMNPNDAKAVKELQKYTKWIIDQSIQASKLWRYNTVQDPSLDPRATNPISAYGLRLSMSINKDKKQMVWDTIKDWNGQVIMFSKDDCIFCHEQAQAVRWLKINTDIDVHGASLLGDCPAFVASCSKGELVDKAAQLLNIEVVPSFYVYLPDNVWIRVSNGLISADELEDRIYNFFIAWRSAVQKGLKSNDVSAPMSFDDPKDMSEFKSLLMRK